MDAANPDPEAAHALAVAAELRGLISKLRRRLREQAHVGDFTFSQAQVLTLLERDGPATVSTLARAQGVRPQSMGELLAVLKAAGLVTGAPDPADGRQTVLSITPECREKIRASRAAREDWLAHAIQAKFSPVEQQQFATGVALLSRLVDE